LIEIGGSFRLPEICRAGGVKMREVGTTNRTRLSDYEEAITSKTALLLRVHASNYRIVGFTEETSLLELVMLGKRHQIPVVDDLGSGDLIGVSERIGLAGEPLVMTSVHAGASVVTFSGDKLLGGPQAGIAVGQAEMITKMRKHPLMRAVRPGKLTFAALDATLRAYLFPSALGEKLPLWKMLEASLETLEKKGKLLIAAIEDSVKAKGFQVNLLMSEAYSGGGSLPTQCLPSRAITFNASGRKLLRLQKHLRQGNPALIGYLKDSSLKLDLRTMLLESDEEIIQVIQSALLQR